MDLTMTPGRITRTKRGTFEIVPFEGREVIIQHSGESVGDEFTKVSRATTENIRKGWLDVKNVLAATRIGRAIPKWRWDIFINTEYKEIRSQKEDEALANAQQSLEDALKDMELPKYTYEQLSLIGAEGLQVICRKYDLDDEFESDADVENARKQIIAAQGGEGELKEQSEAAMAAPAKEEIVDLVGPDTSGSRNTSDTPMEVAMEFEAGPKGSES